MRRIFLLPTAAAVALIAGAAQAADFFVTAGPGTSDGIHGSCTPGPRRVDSPTPDRVSVTCGSSLGVGSSAATSSFGHIGASASAVTLTGSSLGAQEGGEAFLQDFLVFTSTDPTAIVTSVSANLLLDGILNASGVTGFSGGDARLTGDVRLGSGFFQFSYRIFSNGTVEPSTNQMAVSGSVLGPNFNAGFTTPLVQVALNSPVTFELQLDTLAESGGAGASATSDFGGSFKLPTGSDAFNLGAGITVNGADGDWLVNNRFNDPLAAPTSGVPEPASWALMIAGFGLAGALLRRRRIAAA
jgi:hypothetical protein